MAWSDETARVLDAGLFEFGQDVSYTPKGGVAGTVRGIFDAAFEVVSLEGGVSVSSVQPALGVKLADLAAAPRRGDSFVIGAKTYEVRDVREDGQGGAQLLAHES